MSNKLIIDNLTVLIPTYNRLELLSKILDTIPSSINVIVGDNGAYIPDSFKTNYPSFLFDKREKKLEALENWNKCIELVETEWFIIPSDDDLYFEETFHTIANIIQKYKDFDLIVFGHNVIDGNGKMTSSWKPMHLKELSPPFAYEVFKYGVEARFPSILFKTKIVSEMGFFDTSFKITAGDSKLIQKCMLYGKTVFIPEFLGCYRSWEKNSTNLAMCSAEWLNEIDRWQDEILLEASVVYSTVGKKLKIKNIKDEVFARNLLGGITRIRKKDGFVVAAKFINENRYPFRANFKTQLVIIKTLFLG